MGGREREEEEVREATTPGGRAAAETSDSIEERTRARLKAPRLLLCGREFSSNGNFDCLAFLDLGDASAAPPHHLTRAGLGRLT